jgi:hypothetical protein
MTSSSDKSQNPYVGPRAFKPGERLYGRDSEILNLVDFLIAERIVVLYSPSGAGKTSLIQAALVPELTNENFHVLPVMRVSLETQNGIAASEIENRYILSLLLSLEEGLEAEEHPELSSLSKMSFQDYLGIKKYGNGDGKAKLFIFDQFEEIFTLNPTDRNKKKSFFVQIGEILRNQNHWAVFSLREEYLAGLDPFRRYVPTRFSNCFRLELLKSGEALKAIQNPAKAMGVQFDDDAAQRMVDDLRRVWVQQSDGTKTPEIGTYLEPVQLQVCCLQLWERLPDDRRSITEDDITDFGDLDNALGRYYDEQVDKIARKSGCRERQIREWFHHQLITDEGVRRDVLKGQQESQGLDNRVIRALVDSHLVRSERRRGFTWFELSHDRLIEPVRDSNSDWFDTNLSSLQRQTASWIKQGRSTALLFTGDVLKEADKWAGQHAEEMTQDEADFLDACHEAQAALAKAKKVRLIMRGLIVGAILVVCISAVIGYRSYEKRQPWAYLRNLTTGVVHPLRGAKITVGRSTDKFKNDIHLRPRTVSRLHLFILNNNVALDMRSMNGTTVNGDFLPYGTNRTLVNGDLIVLTGLAPFRYEIYGYTLFRKIQNTAPASGWGILIDGRAKRILFLEKSDCCLCLNEQGQYQVKEANSKDCLLMITKAVDGSVSILDVVDSHQLIAVMKEGDYDYNTYNIPAGRQYSYFQTKREGRPESHDIFEVAYKYVNSPFQIVPIIEDIEAESP